MVERCLNAIASKWPECDYYKKSNGLRKWWDGYDNEPIVWIDDPVSQNVDKDPESIQQLKNVMSTGRCQVEVKYGSLLFDAKIIILTTNFSPEHLANTCGADSAAPMLRRFKDTLGDFHLDYHKARNMQN